MLEGMKKQIFDYVQLSLQGTGMAALGTLSIFEPRLETVLFGGICILLGLGVAFVNKGNNMSPMTLVFIFMGTLSIDTILFGLLNK